MLFIWALWVAAVQASNCDDGTWGLTADNYRHFETDKNFLTWWAGGQNAGGPIFKAQQKGKDSFLTYALATQFFPTGSAFQFGCTLENGACNVPDGCESYKIHNDTTHQIGEPIHWAWFATHSISVVSSFARTFHEAFQNAGTQVNFELLDLTDTFTKPSKNPQILTKDLLIGFSFLVTAAFSLVPVAGTILGAGVATAVVGTIGGAAGGVLSTANGILSNSLSSGASLDSKAADFGTFMAQVWNVSTASLDSLVSDLMSGQAMDGPQPLLLSVLDGGGWIDAGTLNRDALSITSLQSLIYKDLLQRGINYIWSQSKIWVSFADLQDDPQMTKCLADKNGWQASKTCADGGVYYLYRFNENGHLDGNLDYPWGADKMSNEPYGLNPSWVTHSSASSYRSQNNGEGGFAYDYTKVPTNLSPLLESISKTHTLSDLNALTGVWNISVCDMGTHWDWNTDFTQKEATSKYGKLAFPCCCGPQCSQTAAFVASAQMNNFDTIVDKCKNQLAPCDAWPPGVTEVDFGDAGTIQKKEPSGNTCVY